MKTVYRFPIEIFYEPDAFKFVNELMEGFGLNEKFGMSGNTGHTDLSLESKVEIILDDERLETCRKIIQTGFDEIQKDKPELSKLKITVKKGYKL